MPQTITNISLEDIIEIPSQRSFTDAGQMIVPAAFARTGSMNYLATTLNIKDAVAGEFVSVFRDEAEVFNDASMESFRSAPVTLGHPKDSNGNAVNVSSENSKELQVGTLEGMPTRDEDTLGGTLIIARQDAIDVIEEGTVELSAGYTCDLVVITDDAGENTYHQKNIRANHIAIVEKGRGGSALRMADAEEDAEDDKDKGKDKKTEDKSEKKTEDKKSSGDNAPKNNDGGKIKEANVVKDQINDSMANVEEETIERSEAYTVYLKAEATSKASWEVYLASNARLAEHARAAGLYDEDDLPVFAKADLYDSMSAQLDVANEAIAKLHDELEASVEARVQVITIAKDLTALDDFAGKTIAEIRKLVVADQLPNLNLGDKGEAYINARFDILIEDSDSGNSQMSKLLTDDITKVVDTKYKDPVKEARQNMIDRNSKK